MSAGPPESPPPGGPGGHHPGPYPGPSDQGPAYDEPHDPSSAERARAVGQGLGTGAKATARGVKATARVTGRFGRFAVGQAKRAANAQGAEQSGLNRLIYLHAANAAGDAAVAISLATTVFFAGATSEARGQVALFLGLTMLPFAIVAPLIGPFLDRFSHGRRWAIGATFALRGFLCWVLAGAVADESALLYPAALGVLVVVQGVRRHPRGRRPPAASRGLHAGQGQRAGLAGRRRRRRPVGADRRARRDRRRRVVAALRLPRLHRRHRRRDPAAEPGRLQRG